jgi:hypothetical protein
VWQACGKDGQERWLCRICDFATYGVQQVDKPLLALEVLPAGAELHTSGGAIVNESGPWKHGGPCTSEGPGVNASRVLQGVVLNIAEGAIGGASGALQGPGMRAHEPVLCTFGGAIANASSALQGSVLHMHGPVTHTSGAAALNASGASQGSMLRTHEAVLLVKPLAKSTAAVQRAGGVAALLTKAAGVSLGAALVVARDVVALPMAKYEEVRSRLQEARLVAHHISLVPEWVLDSYRGKVPKASDAVVEAALRRMPSSLWKRLMPFQVEGVRFGLRCFSRCLIGDEMGVYLPSRSVPFWLGVSCLLFIAC